MTTYAEEMLRVCLYRPDDATCRLALADELQDAGEYDLAREMAGDAGADWLAALEFLRAGIGKPPPSVRLLWCAVFVMPQIAAAEKRMQDKRFSDMAAFVRECAVAVPTRGTMVALPAGVSYEVDASRVTVAPTGMVYLNPEPLEDRR